MSDDLRTDVVGALAGAQDGLELTVDLASTEAFVRFAEFAEEVTVYASTSGDPVLRQLCEQLASDMDLELEWLHEPLADRAADDLLP